MRRVVVAKKIDGKKNVKFLFDFVILMIKNL